MTPLRDMAPDVAGLVLDLARCGALGDVGDMPFGWREAEGQERTRAPEHQSGGGVGEAVLAAPKPAVDKMKTEPKPAAVVVAAAAEIWQDGEPGGVVVVLGGLPLVGEAEALVKRMLAAVGCGALPLGWVGLANVDAVARDAEVGRKVGAAVATFSPQKVLVLGGMTLQAWSGKTTGVEAWRPGGEDVLPGVAHGVGVGVTYAPDMLLAKPLFKRLAWRHLLAWEQAWNGHSMEMDKGGEA